MALDQKVKDEEYAQRFWKRAPKGTKEVMAEYIITCEKAGKPVMIFTSQKGIEEKDREKLSAYRELAKALGYEVGQYRRDPNTYVASALVKKFKK